MNPFAKLVNRGAKKVVTATAATPIKSLIQRYGVVVATNVATAIGTVIVMSVGKKTINDAKDRILGVIDETREGLIKQANRLTKMSADENHLTLLLGQMKEQCETIAKKFEDKIVELHPDPEKMTTEDKILVESVRNTVSELREAKTPQDLMGVMPKIAIIGGMVFSDGNQAGGETSDNQVLQSLAKDLSQAWEKNFQTESPAA